MPPAEGGCSSEAAHDGDGDATIATAISVGNGLACAILSDGRVKCWGQNQFGQLGIGDTASRGDDPGEMGTSLPPLDFGLGRSATEIVSGHRHSCALLDDGNVKCWGRNDLGVLGLGDTNDRGDAPGEMGTSLPYVSLGAGISPLADGATGQHSCAMVTGNTLKCWGLNNRGQLGLGDFLPRRDMPGKMGDSLPTVDLGTDLVVSDVSAGVWHSCALLTTGQIKCWGNNLFGELGTEDSTILLGADPADMGDNLAFVELGTGYVAQAIEAGHHTNCAILTTGLKCWGENLSGQLGLGDINDRGDEPGEMGDGLPHIDLGTVFSLADLKVGIWTTCALSDVGRVKCWGNNASGELGQGHTDNLGDDPNEMGDSLPFVPL